MLQPGTIIDNRFEVLSLLGEGGFGEVYLTRQLQLDRKVAVKLLKADVADEDCIARFEREAKALSELRHPSIAMFIAFGIWGSFRYTALEYAAGEPLARVVTTRGALSSSQTQALGIKILEGLAHAHANGIIHRDMKPGNIIVSEDFSTVKIIDFGLAQIFAKQRLTQEGLAVGSVQYMSPEQCLGQAIDARTDLYSVGCVMYECLTGKPAFYADQAVAVMYQQINDKRALFAKGNDEIAEFVNRLLEKNPADRFASAQEAVSHLRGLKVNDSVPPKAKEVASTSDVLADGPKRGSKRVLVAVTCGVLAAGVLAVGLLVGGPRKGDGGDDEHGRFGPPVSVVSRRMHGDGLQSFLWKRLAKVDALMDSISRIEPSQVVLVRAQIENELEEIWQRPMKEHPATVFGPALQRQLCLPWEGNFRRVPAARAAVMLPIADEHFETCAWKALEILDLHTAPMAVAALNANLAAFYIKNGRVKDAHSCVETMVRVYDKVLSSHLPGDKARLYTMLSGTADTCLAAGAVEDATELYRCAFDLCLEVGLALDQDHVLQKYWVVLRQSERYEDSDILAKEALARSAAEGRRDLEAMWLCRRETEVARLREWRRMLPLYERIVAIKEKDWSTEIFNEYFAYHAYRNLGEERDAAVHLKNTIALLETRKLKELGEIKLVDLRRSAGSGG